MRGLFRRRRNRFIEYLCAQAEFMEQGLALLLTYVRQPDSQLAEDLTRMEKQADEVRRILIDELNRTFTTPIDREDIFSLSRALDDVLDYTDSTVKEMVMLEIEPNEHIGHAVERLLKAAQNLNKAVHIFERDWESAAEFAFGAKAQEDAIEADYRSALTDLFQNPKDIESIVEMLKLREIYRHLSNAGDRCDELANLVINLGVKAA